MKRFLIRAGVLTGVVALGLFAIAQAQRMMRAQEEIVTQPDVAQAELSPLGSADPGLLPVPDAPQPVANDPFNTQAGFDAPPGPAAPQPFTANAHADGGVAPADIGYTEAAAPTADSGNPLAEPPAFVDQSPGAPAMMPQDNGLSEPHDPRAGGNVDDGRFAPAEPQMALPDEPQPPADAAPYAEPEPTPAMPAVRGPRRGADDQYVPSRMREQQAPADQLAPPDGGAPTEPPADALIVPAADAPPGEINPREPYRGDSSAEGTGRPGSRELEGVQGPSLTVEKLAPSEVQVGRSATMVIKVRNSGTAIAREVEIHDEVPRGAQLVGTEPQADRGNRGELVWQVGTLKPGDETSVKVELIPTAEGEMGSIATARFAADATARSVVTRPQLSVALNGPREVLIGQQVRLAVKVSNSGSGIANDVVLLGKLPNNLQHPAGSEVEYAVGKLAPGESRDVVLVLAAAKPGPGENVVTAEGDGNLKAEDRLQLEVLAPQLDINIEGASRRFLQRQASYNLTLANPGTAPARDVELTAQIPPGLQFVEANNLGEYDQRTRTVHWSLDELPAGEQGTVTLILMPTEEGENRLNVTAKAKQVQAVQKEQPILIEGVAGTSFEVVDVHDPIEVGGESSYEIRVVNQGTKSATNVRIVAILPDGMKALDAEGPTQHTIQGTEVSFDPLPRLAPKADTTYRVRVEATTPGDMRLRVQLLSDEIRTPVTKEESTRVFADE